ncbi:hypothetical protein CHARACLAT_023631 [Characodon lateralis]|uniref:C2H2-type domain-containing protein n=1 Tax=Characodon lateralis TaxID=208331 RepID=A0ABU7E744_9TELE|nr:hypothetical protein [Characodon lateralis]
MLQTSIVNRRISSRSRMSEMMKVKAEDPGGLSLEPLIPAASTSELEQKQDSKDLMSPDQQLLVSKEEFSDLWNSSLNQRDQEPPYIKEEDDEPWNCQEEEQLDEKEETESIAVRVKSEYDEEKCPLSKLHCIKIEDNRDTEAPTRRSVEQMEAEPDGEHCGGTEPERNPYPNTCSPPDTDESSSDSSKTVASENEKADDWQGPLTGSESEGRDSLNSQKSRTPQSDMIINEKRSTAKTSFSCSECGKPFISKQSLQRHLKSQTGKRFSSSLNNDKCLQVKKTIDSHKRSISEGSQFSCDASGKTFLCEDNFQSHLSVHAGDKPFSCDICGKRFRSKSYARKHIMLHSGKRAYSCDECGKGFIKKSQLQTHVRLHSAERPFICDVCGKGFNQKSHLKVHMRFHSGEQPTVCDLCGKTFSVKYYLKDHMRSHTGERPFACDVCGKSFRRKANLDLHIRVHVGEKPFACSVCNRTFSRQGNLKQHMSVHSDDKRFVCSVCSKGFSRKEHLKLHIGVHTGEKAFSCSECGKSFLQKIHLRRHMLIHTGARPFACDVCDGRFKLKHHLLTHMLSHV